MPDTPTPPHGTSRPTHRGKWISASVVVVVLLAFSLLWSWVSVDAGSSVTGSITNPSGQPLAGVRVTLEAPGGATDSTLSDGEGCFSVFTLHAPGRGRIQLTFSKADLGPLLQVASAPGDYAMVATLGTGVGGDTSYGQLVRIAPGDTIDTECIPLQ